MIWAISDTVPSQLFDECEQAQWWQLLTKAEWNYQRYDGFTPGEGLYPQRDPPRAAAIDVDPARDERHAAATARGAAGDWD